MHRKGFNLSLYFIADPSCCGGRDVAEVVRAAARGGATMVQLRDKNSDRQAILARARSLKDICAAHGIPLIVNDHPDIALEAGADGVHLGQGDMDPAEARRRLGPEAIIGVTAFTPAHFAALDPDVVDYAGTGPVYPTQTDKGKPVLGVEGFRRLRALSPVPVAAIGGIAAENVAAVLAAGADGLAVMRGIGEAADPEGAARSLVDIIQSSSPGLSGGSAHPPRPLPSVDSPPARGMTGWGREKA